MPIDQTGTEEPHPLSRWLVYGYLILSTVPLGVLAVRYGFATGSRRGVTLSEWTYGLFVLTVIIVLSIGAILGMRRDDSGPISQWDRISVLAPTMIAALAAIAGTLLLNIEIWDYPRLLSLGLFWFASSVSILSVLHILSRYLPLRAKATAG